MNDFVLEMNKTFVLEMNKTFVLEMNKTLISKYLITLIRDKPMNEKVYSFGKSCSI